MAESATLTNAPPPNIPPPPEGFDSDTPPTNIPPPPAGFDSDAPPPQQSQPQPPITDASGQLSADLAAGRNPYVEGAKRDWQTMVGLGQGAARTAAGLVDLANTPLFGVGKGETVAIPEIKKITDWVRAKTEPQNPQQDVGQMIESALEWLPAGEEKAAVGGMTYAQKLKKALNVASFMEEHPGAARLMRVGYNTAKTAVRAGVEQGAQTYVKTGGDEQQTEEAAKTGAMWGGGLGAGASILQETAGAAAARRAGARTIAGAQFETIPRTEDLMLRNLEQLRTQGRADPATQAVDEALGNIAKTGVANSMNASLSARAEEVQPLPRNRQLPGGGGIRVGAAGAETTPTKEGEILQPARKRQIGTRVVEGKGSPTGTPEYRGTGFTGEEAPPPPREAGEPPTQRGSHREPVYQYLTSAKPETPPAAEGETGPAAMIFTDKGEGMSVERARQQLAQYDRILNDENALGEMGVREHGELTAARDDLEEQLRRFDDFAASQPHFPAPNPLEAVRNTSSLSDAAEHLKALHGRFWDAADAASGGEFTALRDEEKRLQKQIYGETPTGRLDELRQQLQENQQKQLDFFDRYRTTVSPQEWATARRGYQDGIVLQNLDNLIQGHFNGITRAEEARGVAQRAFKPTANFNNQLENFYNTGFRDSETNRQVLERTIGQGHMDDLKRIGALFQDADRMEATQKLYKSIGQAIRRHYHGIRGAASSGVPFVAAHYLGREAGITAAAIPPVLGTISGTNRYITERLMTDPDFLKRFTYSIENNLPPRTAAPILAARAISTVQNQPAKKTRGKK